MDSNKHLPLSKPPKVSATKVPLPTPAVAQITQKRMATLYRYNWIFFIFGLFSLALGYYAYSEQTKDKKVLDRYEAIFKRFPTSSILVIKNDSEVPLKVLKIEIFYIRNDGDSISRFIENGKNFIEPGRTQEFKIKESQGANNEIQMMFFALQVWKEGMETPLILAQECPENRIISLEL